MGPGPIPALAYICLGYLQGHILSLACGHVPLRRNIDLPLRDSSDLKPVERMRVEISDASRPHWLVMF